MASGYKSVMPDMIFVIYTGAEIRYYTTPETFVEGFLGYADGPHAQIEVFFPSGKVDDSITQKLQTLRGKKHPSWVFNPPWVDKYGRSTPAQLAQQRAAKRQWSKQYKAYKKTYLDKVHEAIGTP